MVFPLNQGSQTIVGLLRPPLQVDFDLVLRQPIESTAFIGHVDYFRVARDLPAIASKDSDKPTYRY